MSKKHIQSILPLLDALENGQLDKIPCPNCRRDEVSVWFTNASPHEYRTWFVCSHCNFEQRVNNSECPPHFSEARIHKGLEQYDRKLIDSAKFKGPRWYEDDKILRKTVEGIQDGKEHTEPERED